MFPLVAQGSRTATDQALYQLCALPVTLLLATLGGCLTGEFCLRWDGTKGVQGAGEAMGFGWGQVMGFGWRGKSQEQPQSEPSPSFEPEMCPRSQEGQW